MIRVLQLPNTLDKQNGRMSVIMNVYRKIDHNKVQFDFACTDSSYNNYEDEIRKLGGKIYLLPKTQFSIHNIRSFIKKILKGGDYSFIHYHAISKWSCALSVAKKYGVKVIVHSHSAGLSDSVLKSMRNRIFSLNLLTPSYQRVAISNKAGKKLFMFEPFITIPNMINYNKFNFSELKRAQIRKRFNLSDNDVLIGCVGRIVKVKNQEFSISVLRKLDNKYKIMFVGSENQGSGRISKLKKIVAKYGLSNRVIFTGGVNNVEDYYSAFDIFWLPSLFEGMPTVVLEALANGLPCIVSNRITNEIDISNHLVFLPIDNNCQFKWANITKNESCHRDKNAIQTLSNSLFTPSNVINKWCKIYNVE